MRKQEEIQVLQSLKGDTYFAQKFGSDIDQMCENIKNDFPIEMGCMFITETEALKKALAQTKKKADEELLAFAQEIIPHCDLAIGNEVVAGMCNMVRENSDEDRYFAIEEYEED